MVRTVTDILPPRYRGARLIARGGMGEVYRATDDVLGRAVAVKLLAERYAADEDVRARFTREALAAARLSSHTNAVTIFDVGEWNERPFIVMAYLAGGSLADRLRAEGAQPPERVARWVEDAAAALDAAHRGGIVHRDVKPGNLLTDGDDVVHVADFGVARAADLTSFTSTGTILGTAGYLSPEQALGRPATAASDRYSLGVTAFELLTGERPFNSDSPTAEASAHVNADVPPASLVNGALPPDVDDVLSHALAKDPEDRFPTCAAFASALRQALDRGEARTRLLAPPDARVAPAARRSPWLPLALAVLVLAGTGGALAAILTRGGDGRAAAPSVVTVTAPGTTLRETVRQTVTQEPAPPPSPSPPPAPSADGHDLNDRGYALLQQGDLEGALPLLQRAVEALRGAGPGDPYEAYANFNLGVTLGQLGRCDEALTYLRVADGLEDDRDVDKAIKRAEKCAREG